MTTAVQQRWQRVIYAVSAFICLAVAFLILGPRPQGLAVDVDVSGLPRVNATLNALTAVLLCCGFAAIRTKRVTLHKRLMLTAFGTSTLFLLTYIVYHWFKEGPTRYEGPLRGVYLVILLTHIVLAAGILPLALTTLARALMGAFDAHRRIAPITLGIWLYVSATGVLIYLLAHA